MLCEIIHPGARRHRLKGNVGEDVRQGLARPKERENPVVDPGNYPVRDLGHSGDGHQEENDEQS